MAVAVARRFGACDADPRSLLTPQTQGKKLLTVAKYCKWLARERLVAEINQASREWRQLSIASDSAQQDLIRGLKLMLRALQRSFERVDWQLERSSNTDPPA